MRRSSLALAAVAICGVAACGGRVGIDVSAGNDAGSEASPAAPGSSAKCTSNADCASTEYCDHAGTCGTGGTRGACKGRPLGCPDIYGPVCACDGQTYDNACLANAAGTDVGSSPSCAPLTGSFQCGNTGKTCDAATTYCQRTTNDVGGPGQPAEFDECLPLPPTCKTDTACACFPKDTPCLTFSCKEIPIPNTKTYGLQIICPGG